jgi:amino acid adenylation domain-containing protein
MVKKSVKYLTLIDLLQAKALNQADQCAYTVLLDGETEKSSITYAELDRRSRSIGTLLQDLGLAGQRILLVYPPGLDYIAAFFGCLYAGSVAVPVYPPRFNRSLERLQGILLDCQATVALTTKSIQTDLELHHTLKESLGTLRWIATDNIDTALADLWNRQMVSKDALAFLQYTSGSTTMPKGVMLTHDNLLQNLASMHECFGLTSASHGVIWLPPYHDMGLIGGILQPLFGGFPVTLLQPTAFLQRPIRWLQAISRYHGTVSGGPDFAYELCVRKITPEQRSSLDLSCWTTAFTGAEPIRHETLRQFTKTFAECGFNGKAFYPCYGLAEATLFVTGSSLSDSPLVQTFQKSALEHNLAVTVPDDDKDARMLVSCGKGLDNQIVTIVNPETSIECSPGKIGEVWISGPSVAQGYWKRPEQTEDTFHASLANSGKGPFLRTGDLGFLLDGELFITGRLKDLIIIRGRNHYPQDIEITSERCHPALQAGCCAAFSCEVDGEERLIIAQELKRECRNPNVEEIAGTMRQAIAAGHELQVYTVLLLRFGSIPKTSSGKIQRHLCRASFLEQSLHIIGQSTISNTHDSVWELEPDHDFGREALFAVSVHERQTFLQNYLREHIAKVAGVHPSQIDGQDSLGRLGLDSLMALELQNEIETRFDVAFSVTNFLSRSTLAQIADDLLAQLTDSSPLRPIKTSEREKFAQHPLSYGQSTLWFMQALSPENGIFNIARAVKILGQLDSAALQDAFQSLVDRHASLRTTFALSNETPSQHILAAIDTPLQVEDATTWDEDTLDTYLDERAYAPIDLVHGPLLRLYLFNRAPQEHVLLFVVHHIAVDFWSLTVLVDELIQFYAARKSGIDLILPATNTQFTDYIHRQNEMLTSSAGEHLWAYWQKQLSGDLPRLSIDMDRPASANPANQGASQRFQLDVHLTRGLKELAHREEVTPYMLLISALHVLLYRYTGQEDIVVGSPTSGRSFSDLMRLVGYFVNPVAIRANLAGEPTFRDFLQSMRQTVVEAFEHQDYPLALLIERLQPKRDAQGSEFFAVVFNWLKTNLPATRNLEAFALDEPGVQIPFATEIIESLPLKRQVTQFDLELTMAEVGDEFHGLLKYNAALFQIPFVVRMLEHFRILLENIVAEPDQKISHMPLLTSSEYYQLTTEWNDSNDYTQDMCIHHLLEAQALLRPEALALSCAYEKLTYAELNARSNQVAHGLLAMGVTPGQTVALLLESSPRYIISLFGILKVGGVFVCLDPNYPTDRLQQILGEIAPALLVCDMRSLDLHSELLRTLRVIVTDAHVDQLANLRYGGEYISIDDFSSLPHINPAIPVHATDPAYIAYTSGSTGKPKGIVHTHQSFSQFISWQSERFSIQEGQRVAQMASATFDVSYCEIFGTLCFGATLCLIPSSIRHDPHAFTIWMAQERISLLQVVASFFSQMLHSGKNDHLLPDLRFVLFVGEALPASMMQIALSTFPDAVQFFNLYGPTEAVAATCYRVQEVSSQRTIPIGRAIHGRQILILDAHQQLCPIGMRGEIYIRSSYLAVGYFRQEETTRQAFIQNPLHNAYPDRVYRTGDLGRWLPDGNIEFAGRIDNQVKLRGMRLELEDVEAALARHSLVLECAAIVQNYSENDQRLIAYVVPSDKLSSQELRVFLQGMLPAHMVPAVFLFLEALPRTPNGKLDRKALPLPEILARDSVEEYQAPRTLLELLVARMWSDLLHVDQVGIYNSFFDLGGHSLLAMQVINRLRQLTSVELPLRTLLETPTVAHLGTEIMQKGGIRLSEKMNKVAQRVAQFSDDEVKILLSQKRLQSSQKSPSRAE